MEMPEVGECSSTLIRATGGLIQVPNLQPVKALEVAIVGENGGNTMLSTQGSDLRIEHQVASRIGPAHRGLKMLEKISARQGDMARRRGHDPVDEVHRLSNRGRRIEDALMCDNAHEFGQAEDRQSPRLRPFGQPDQFRRRRNIEVGLATVRVDQDIGVNGYHSRSRNL